MKTFVKRTQPWGLFARYGHRVLCSDGVVRAASMSQTADTWFSVPASIRVRGEVVTGYVTTDEGPEGELVYRFRHHDEHRLLMGDNPGRRGSA